MSDFNGIRSAAGAANSIFIERASQALAKQCNESQNDWFEKQHKTIHLNNGGNADDFSYATNDYERVAFKSKRDVTLFVEEMNKQGINVVATPFKQNGQYLAEISKHQDNTDASHIIEKFSQENYVKTYDVNTIDVLKNDEYEKYINDYQKDFGNNVAQAIFNSENFGSVGTAVSYIAKVNNTLQEWGKEGTNKVATVYGNDTVILDGKFVTDENIKNSVLNEHYAHINDAYKTVLDNKLKKITPDVEAAQNIIDSVYKQNYEVKVNGKGTVNYKEKWSFGVLDDYSKKINSEKIALNNKNIRNAIASQKLSVLSEKEQSRTMELLEKDGLSLTDLANEGVSDKIATQLRNEFGQKKKEEALAAALAAKGASKLTKDQWKETYRNIRNSTGNNYDKFLKETFALKARNKNFLKGTKEGVMVDLDENGSTLVDDLKNISWLKGTNLLDGDMTAQKLVMINAEFLKNASKQGYMFIKSNGEFDIDKLKGLGASELEKFDLTERTRDMLVDVNSKGSFGVTNEGDVKAVFGAGVGFILKIDDNKEGYADIQELSAYVKKGINYGEKALTEMKKVVNAERRMVDKLKLNHSERWQSIQDNLKNKGGKPQRRQGVKPKDPKPLSANQIKKQEKYSAKMHQKALKVQRKQNSILAKMNRAVQEAKKKIAESALGKAVQAVSKAVSGALTTFLIYYFGIGAIGAFFIQVCALVAVLVIFLVDLLAGIFNIGNWFAPTSYKDTVAFALKEELLKQEDIFVATLAELPNQAAEHPNDTKFGFFGEDISQYVGHFTNLVYLDDEKKLKINPFWRDNTVTATVNKEYLTNTNKWNGTHTYDVGTNLNYYSLLSYNGAGLNYNDVDINTFSEYDLQKVQYGVSNGHTSNIKDILAMTDIMYQMEASDSDDSEEGLKSILGRSPAQLNVSAIGTNIGNFFKSVGDVFVSIWNWITGNNDATLEPITVNAVSYNTVHNYAFNLFEMSHQIYLYLNVEYCDINKKVVDNTGNEIKFKDSSGVVFGVCPNPESKNFPIGYVYGDEVPEPKLGNHFLNETDSEGKPYFDISVSVEDNYKGSLDDLCLWEGMYEKGNTLVYPFDHHNPSYLSKVQNSDCWHEASVTYNHYETTFTQTIEDIEIHTSGGTNTSIHDRIPKESVETQASAYIQQAQNERPDEYYYIEIDDNTVIWIERKYGQFAPEDGDIMRELVPVQHTHYHDSGEHYYVSVDIDVDIDKYHITYCKEWTHIYKRECHGHEFVYCGGHIATHSQGNVFSVTNDQMAITEVADSDVIPLSLFDASKSDTHWRAYSKFGYDGDANEYEYLFDERYPELEGKVNHKEMKYDTALSASQTGGGKTVLEDIYQGTAVSKGLNIIVDEVNSVNGWGDGVAIKDKNGNYCRLKDGEILTSGTDIDASQLYYCRDIFDIDCIIYKGNNILPYRDYTKYEGWTADNIYLVCNRMQLDWYDTYGFDIATEIGEFNYALSTQDIDMLIVGLKATYGSLSEKEEETLRLLLKRVGHGHYTSHEHSIEEFKNNISYSDLTTNDVVPNHAYLSFTCYAKTSYKSKKANGAIENVKFSGSCEAGNSVDMVWYMINALLKKKGGFTSPMVADEAVGLNSPTIKPLHYLYHAPYDLDENYDEDSNTLKLDCYIGDAEVNGYDLKKFHIDPQQCIIIGYINENGIQAMKDWLAEQGLKEEELAYYTCSADSPNDNKELVGKSNTVMLSTGAYISSEYYSPITVDLNQMGVYSGILLRTQADFTTGGSDLGAYMKNYVTGEGKAPDMRAQTNNALRTNYYWTVYRTDGRTLEGYLDWFF